MRARGAPHAPARCLAYTFIIMTGDHVHARTVNRTRTRTHRRLKLQLPPVRGRAHCAPAHASPPKALQQTQAALFLRQLVFAPFFFVGEARERKEGREQRRARKTGGRRVGHPRQRRLLGRPRQRRPVTCPRGGLHAAGRRRRSPCRSSSSCGSAEWAQSRGARRGRRAEPAAGRSSARFRCR